MEQLNREYLYDEIKKVLVKELSLYADQSTIKTDKYVPVSISARHVHLQKDHIELLFGKGYQLTKYREISQPGQFSCEEKVTIKSPKGMIKGVRIVGPARKQTQVEISRTDSRKLGISPPVRQSGDLSGSSPISIEGPKGRIDLIEGCIIADRHIHMSPQTAEQYGVVDQQQVRIVIEGLKGGTMNHVLIRVDARYALDMHIDTDDANAFGLNGGEQLQIIIPSNNGGL